MPRGQPPKPTALKVLQGTDQRCRVNPHEPMPDIENVTRPDGMSPLAAQHFDKTVAELKSAKMVSCVDVQALAMYCEMWVQWRDACDKSAQYGAVIKGPKGIPVESPYMKVANKLASQMRQLMVEFGMTPSSRTRVSKTETGEPEDEWEALKAFRRS